MGISVLHCFLGYQFNIYSVFMCIHRLVSDFVKILTNEYVEETMADEEDEEVETLVGSESSVDPPKTSDPKATPSSGTTKPEGKSTEKPVVKKEEVVKVERGDKVANKPPEGQLIPPMDTSTPVKDSDVRQRKAQSASPT